jgi:hypothetical protein
MDDFIYGEPVAVPEPAGASAVINLPAWWLARRAKRKNVRQRCAFNPTAEILKEMKP